jgi:cell division septal protein FtsQ
MGVGYAAVRASQDPRLALVAVQVTGCDRSAPADVISAAAFSAGQNVWLLDVDGATARIKALPWVGTTAIRRNWPNHVTIDVVERVPVARLTLPPGGGGEEPTAGEALLDERLRVLALGPPDPRDLHLPTLTVSGVGFGAVRLGAELGATPVAPALRALQALQTGGLPVVSVQMDDVTGIAAQSASGIHVLFGTPDDLPRKIALFLSIEKKIDRPQDVRYVDVRSLRAPTVLFK